ncbi:MAG: glutamine amidotransferase [Desulfobacteraceae bacterium]|nr:MAG: glutamine amidotransferase [Desulfobacteraceae bacterium]
MKKLFIIKCGTTFADTAAKFGDFDTWTIKGLRISDAEAQVVDVACGDVLPKPVECKGAVLTGSHAMVTDSLPWSAAIAVWIGRAAEADVPLLGICYGHQLLAHALGGRVGFHPAGKEIGTVDVYLLSESMRDPLFHSLPSPFPAHTTHSQTVLSLPRGAVRLASNSFEPNHAFRFGPSAWGVQFHPEYDRKIMESYVLEQAKELGAAGRNVPEILGTIRETPSASEILKRFADFIKER